MMPTPQAVAVPHPVVPARSKESRARLAGIDSIRFVSALVVLFGHLGLLKERLHGSAEPGLIKIAFGVFNNLFNGPAAVIVFFVISGFCIHYPFRNGRPLGIMPFFSRRFIRIVPPALVFMFFLRFIIGDHSGVQDTVLWSVVCETIYYFIYPALLYLRKKSSWILLIAISYSCVAVMVALHADLLISSQYAYTAFGWATWIIGLPCWLLGCWLAEHYQSLPLFSPLGIWSFRVAIFIISIVLRMAKFHVSSPFASNCILLDIFAVLACYWIGIESIYSERHGAIQILEKAGRWSYSLYLIHTLTVPILYLLGLSAIIIKPETHIFVIALALIMSYIFYLLVELPSHRIAIIVGRALAKAEHHPSMA